MEVDKNTVIVPWDFTKKADFALEHAFFYANVFSNKVTLVHIVNNDAEIKAAEKRLNDVAEKILKEKGTKPNILVRKGSIFKTIGEIANLAHASLVVMGTHGRRGMQKVFGSHALKVVVSSKIPFVVVQNPPVPEEKNIVVFPVDYRSESKEKIKWAGFLSNYFKVKVHMIYPVVSDKGFKKSLNTNLFFAKKHLENLQIDYDVHQATGKMDFAKETIKYADEINASIILVITTRGISFFDYLFGTREQYIIANSAKVPVMVVNPRPGRVTGGFSAGGG